MKKTSWWICVVPLYLFTLLFVVIMAQITKRIGGRSAMYFSAQQATLGALNGFTEEMINGQKVVKVFNHEGIARDEFDQLNDLLYTQAREANKLGNILGPIMATWAICSTYCWPLSAAPPSWGSTVTMPPSSPWAGSI